MTGPAPRLPGTPLLAAGAADDPAGDGRDYLIRSEERLQVRTVRVRSGWARLEKFVVVETRTITVPVSHEEVRVVLFDNDGLATDPDGQTIDPADVRPPAHLDDDGTNEPVGDTDDLARWLTVSEERVLVSKETVALERVRLHVAVITEQQQITEQVRHERINTEPEVVPTVRPSAPSGDQPTLNEEHR